jgi:sulfur carrier protein
MRVTINSEKKDIEHVDTLEALLRLVGVSSETRGVAVALNGEVVPKSAWASARVQEGDAVEVIHAVQGG